MVNGDDHARILSRLAIIRDRAHAPYSKFHVAAAVVSDDGQVHFGCNVENASYPVGTCAEAGAISAMIAAGRTRIREVFLLGPEATPITPCGACRQRIAEFAAPDVPVHLCNDTGIRRSLTIGELLPHGFDGGSLRF